MSLDTLRLVVSESEMPPAAVYNAPCRQAPRSAEYHLPDYTEPEPGQRPPKGARLRRKVKLPETMINYVRG